MYNKILQISNVNKTSKRLKNDVDIENHRIFANFEKFSILGPDLPMENDIVQQNVFCRKKA
jgi:hypothetical protein